ncbi:MAG TPA: hypothetical protein VK815_17625 [Candidatus Acidoferrales bacterium]|jgi:hypothetical protein|nr:hypothetical protein [Candidatus Acidoferrales bacterium]
MAREKISVRQQLFGFPDEDLKTSLHDEIVLWLKKNTLDLSKKILTWNDVLDSKKLQEVEKRVKKNTEDFKLSLELEIKENSDQLKEKIFFRREKIVESTKSCQQQLKAIESWKGLDQPPECKIEVESQLEIPIKRERYKSTDIVGYADIVFSIREAYPYVSPLPTTPSGKFDSYVNLAEHLKWKTHWYDPRKVAFDAKSAIPSLGELIRQLNTYRTYCTWPFFVVSPDSRFASEIAEEGFGFIKYPDGVITRPKMKKNQI